MDRPDWNEPDHWHRSGLFHVDEGLSRHPVPDPADALREWRAASAGRALPGRRLLVFARSGGERPVPEVRALLRHAGPHWQVAVVEPPCRDAGAAAWLEEVALGPAACRLLAHLPPDEAAAARVDGTGAVGAEAEAEAAAAAPIDDATALHQLLQGWLAMQAGEPPIVWLDDPSFEPLARQLLPGSRLLPGDGRAAPQALRTLAAIEGSPGPVAARDARGWAAGEAARLVPATAGPRIGYAGPIGRGLDLALLQALAEAHPDWQVECAGPLDGVPAEALPRRPNLHWLGEPPPAVLPALMQGWRLGVLPWRGEAGAQDGAAATALLTLLAADLPVVASGWPLEGTPPRGAVTLAGPGPEALGHRAFLHACTRRVGEPASSRAAWRRPLHRWLRRRAARARAALHAELGDLPAAEGRAVERPAAGFAEGA